MMDPDENSSEELEAVPSDMFDSGPSPVSGLGGWATGAVFAVTKVRCMMCNTCAAAERRAAEQPQRTPMFLLSCCCL